MSKQNIDINVNLAGVRKTIIDFEPDEQTKDALLRCIAERGRLRVQMIPAGEMFNGEILTDAYQQLVD
jgi:hypothetical protein